MTLSIKELLADEDVVALRYRQRLEPVERWEVPVHPPTYPGPDSKQSSKERPPPRYMVNAGPNGTRSCELDTIQSQANRMEASYRGELAGVIPRHAVEAGRHRVDFTELPHRLADAAIRATALAGEIPGCFEALEAGDPVPMARLSPLSLVYGAWDSRDTRVRVIRAIGSRIEARDVVERTRSVQYSAAFGQDELGLSDREWEMGSNAGFAPGCFSGLPGGLVVRGGIVQSAVVMLDVLRRYRPAGERAVLAGYLLGLALGGLLVGGRRYHLRSGCALVPEGTSMWETVGVEGERGEVEVDAGAVLEELRTLAREWSAAADVELGGEPRIHRYDGEMAKRMVAAAPASKRGRKGAGDGNAADHG